MDLLNSYYVPGIDLGGCNIVQSCKTFHLVLTTTLGNRIIFPILHMRKENFNRSKAAWTSSRV